MTDLDRTVADARAAAFLARSAPARTRRGWIDSLAGALDAHADELVTIADEESALGEPRLRGELMRTTGQLRALAAAAVEGSHLEATIDHPDPSATPPIPDLRRLLVPLPVIAVYSASNFPFAFSVFGGDTASALAVGSAAIVKAHPGHTRLSTRIAAVGRSALASAGAPENLVQLVHGFEAGVALVRHPGVDAAAFTGSVAGGRALFDEASARARPIPFYGELGSINPVVITPAALARRRDELAAGLIDSFTLGNGQFCTKPGLVFVPAGHDFADRVGAALAHEAPVTRMLTDSIAAGFAAGVDRLANNPSVQRVAGGGGTGPQVFRTSAAALAADPDLIEERFGPATLVVEYDSDADRDRALETIAGSLTATVHAEPGDDVRALMDLLAERSGRVLYGGWPTGVAVSWAQTHGGPYPSTTSLFTSVGQSAMRRFLRPVSYQTTPSDLLPPELRDDNPLGIPQRVDGVLRTA
jgi:NADP-dependent aldehyde dehydrogenase